MKSLIKKLINLDIIYVNSLSCEKLELFGNFFKSDMSITTAALFTEVTVYVLKTLSMNQSEMLF